MLRHPTADVQHRVIDRHAQQHACALQLPLAGGSDLREDEVAAVAPQLVACELGKLYVTLLHSYKIPGRTMRSGQMTT